MSLEFAQSDHSTGVFFYRVKDSECKLSSACTHSQVLVIPARQALRAYWRCDNGDFTYCCLKYLIFGASRFKQQRRQCDICMLKIRQRRFNPSGYCNAIPVVEREDNPGFPPIMTCASRKFRPSFKYFNLRLHVYLSLASCREQVNSTERVEFKPSPLALSVGGPSDLPYILRTQISR